MLMADAPWTVVAVEREPDALGPDSLGGWYYEFHHPDGTVEFPHGQHARMSRRYAYKAGKAAAKSRFSGRDARIDAAFQDLLEVYGTEGLHPIKDQHADKTPSILP